jgi:RNA polymerase sigma-70 factor (ECF subfamily)
MIQLFTLTYPIPSAGRQELDAALSELAHLAAKGAAAAQRSLYEKLYSYAMSIALHYAGRHDDAEEITQDAFVKLFRKLVKDVPTGSIKAYFSRIVINTAIDLLRKRNKEPFVEEITERSAAAAGSARNTGNDRIQQEEIYRLLQMLPPGYRMVFNLHVLEGYKHPEIAKKLGISVGASKSSLAKARKKLKHLATAYYQID